MTEVQNIENITVDGNNFVVADLPEGVQGAIATYARWQAKANEAAEEANIVQAALRDLGSNIVQAIREVKAADDAAEASAAEAAAAAAADDLAPELVEGDASEEAPAE